MTAEPTLLRAGPVALRVLLVEDDANDAELMRAYLAEAAGDGAEVLHVRSLGEGLRLLQSQDVHLTLLDLDLPDSTGFHTLERMRAAAAGPVIVVSGNGHPSLVEEVLKRRAYDVIPKHELDAAMLRRILRLARLHYETGQTLRSTEGRFRALIENSNEALVLLDADGRVEYASASMRRVLGFEAAEALGRHGLSFVHPEDRAAVQEAFLQLKASPGASYTQRARFMHKDGSPRLMESSIVNRLGDAEVAAIVCNYRDLTREEEHRARFDATFEHAAIGLAHVGLEGHILLANRRLCEMFGHAREELVGRAVRDLSHPEDIDSTTALRAQLRSGAIPQFTARKRYLRRDGTTLWVQLSVSLQRDAEGRPQYDIAAFQDVSEMVRAEEHLRTSEARLRAIIGAEPECVKLLDTEGRLLDMNPAGLAMIEADSMEVVAGHCVYNLVTPAYRDAFRALTERVCRGERGSLEFEAVGLKGARRWMEMHAVPLRDEASGKTLLLGITRDVTSRKSAEFAAQRLRRMYAALSATNEAILKTADAGALHRRVCELLVEHGGLKLAAVRLVDQATSWIEPVAHAGDPASYLADARVSVDRSRPQAHGPSARAVLAGCTLVNNDYLAEPSLALWHAAAREAGIAAMMSVPLRRGGESIGLLSLYAGETGWFDPELVGLAERMAENVSFALDNIDREAKRRTAERALRDSEERFRSLTDLSSDWYWEQDAELRFTHTSVDRGSSVYGDPARAQGKARWELPLTPLSCTWQQHRETLAAHRTFRDFEYSYAGEDGKPRYLSASGYPVYDAEGRFTGYRGIAKDISERKRAERHVRVHAERQEAIARFGQFALDRHSTEALYTEAARVMRCEGVDAVCVLEMFTAAGEYLVRATQGEGPHASLGKRGPISPDSVWPDILRENAPRIAGRKYLATRPLDRPWRAWLRDMGSVVYAPVRDDDKPIAMLCIYATAEHAFGSEDVRFAEAVAHVLSTALQRQKAEQRLAHLAQFDALTGLPNRTLVQDRLEQSILQSRRRHAHAGVLFVDLDRFKLINDSLGHHQGDALIRQVGERMLACVRPGDTVGRISGDEFAVVLADMARPDDAALVAQKVLDTLARPFDLGGNEAYVTASIGIAAFPGDGDDAEALLKNADMAMYRAKEQARNSYCFFTAQMNERSMAKVQLNTDLRHAIERSEFQLHYQPKVDLASGKLRGMEALLRWNHPVRGMVSPGEFIPALEDSGLIVAVGEWVVEEACRQVRHWQAAGCMPVPVAVNLSPKQFRRRDLDAQIGDALARAGLSAEFLELEITESCLMENPEDAVRVMRNLRTAGLRISIDDFGTGYSSLSYLTRLPLSALKIDRSFVRDADSSAESASIVRAVIDMAQNLRLTVIAEGVETEQQAGFLRRHGCDQAQGYFYGRPVAAEKIGERLARA